MDERFFLRLLYRIPLFQRSLSPSTLSVLAEGGIFLSNKTNFLGATNLTKLKCVALMAIFSAISIVLGKFLALPMGETLRFSLENTTILLSGMLFGCVPGIITGIVADLLGCILRGYAINPIITLGAAVIGFMGGLFAYRKKSILNISLSVILAHLIGSVVIKTIGLSVVLNYPFWLTLFQRLLNYVVVAIADLLVLWALLKNKSLTNQLQRFLR